MLVARSVVYRRAPDSALADLPALNTLMESRARTFSFAARFLPASLRADVVTLYAFCRHVDDLVDEASSPDARACARETLAQWRAWLRNGACGSAPLPALAASLSKVLRAHRVPLHYLLDLIDGVESDLQPVEVQDFAQLRHYCYHVASTVGLSMAHVLGARSTGALAAAEELGVAMQLTNILRDVGEDFRMGRVYLPTRELESFGCDARHIGRLIELDRGPDRRFRAMMRFQVARAYHQYERGLEGIPLVPSESRWAILLAARLYRGILGVIESQRYDVLRRRAATSSLTKGREALVSALIVMLWSVEQRCSDGRAPSGQRA